MDIAKTRNTIRLCTGALRPTAGGRSSGKSDGPSRRKHWVALWLALLGLLASAFPPAHAQPFVWAQWEEKTIPRRGPASADGLLIYLHPLVAMDVAKAPIMNFFADMARAANWDILRINRLAYVDVDTEDDNQLRFIAEQVDRARREGYRRVVLGGHLRGAWLAVS